MPKLPEPEWLRLGGARARVLAFFRDIDPATVQRALVQAIYDGDIETEGRCQKWYRHDQRVAIDGRLWEPDRARVGWDLDPDLDCFELTLGDEKYLFVNVWVKRKTLETWCQRGGPPQPSQPSTAATAETPIEDEVPGTEAATPPPLGAGLLRQDESPERPVSKTASYEAVKKALQQRGRAKEDDLWQAAREALQGRSVPRDFVRRAIDELWGRPGRTGRPKSLK